MLWLQQFPERKSSFYWFSWATHAGANQPVHWFLRSKGLVHPTRNECLGWFTQIATHMNKEAIDKVSLPA